MTLLNFFFFSRLSILKKINVVLMLTKCKQAIFSLNKIK